MATRSLTTVAENSPAFAALGTGVVGGGMLLGEYAGSRMEQYTDNRQRIFNLGSRAGVALALLAASTTMYDPTVSAITVLLAFGVGGGAAFEVIREEVGV